MAVNALGVNLSPTLSLEEVLEYETKLIQTFNRFDCEKLETLGPRDQFPRLSALSWAILAYCASPHESAALFARALAADPGNPLIAELQTKRREADRDGSKKEYRIPQAWRAFLSTQVVLGYDTNPAERTGDDAKVPASSMAKFRANAGALKRTDWLAYGVNTQMTQSIFPEDAAANLFESFTEVPVLFEVGRHEHVKARAYSGYLHLGRPFYLTGGMSVAAVLYRGYTRHVAQTAVYWDTYFLKRYRSQAGAHFRFDYLLDYFPNPWYAKALFALEHVQAGRETAFFRDAIIPYSHNDLSLTGTVEYAFSHFNLNLYTKFLIRYDDNESIYRYGGPTAPVQRKQRFDFQVTLQPMVIFPIGKGSQLLGYYRFIRNVSNIGSDAYDNKNFESHEMGTGLRITWAGP